MVNTSMGPVTVRVEEALVPEIAADGASWRVSHISALVVMIHSRGRVSKAKILDFIDPSMLGVETAEDAWREVIEPAVYELDELESAPSGEAVVSVPG